MNDAQIQAGTTNKAIAVHYDVSVVDAKHHFESAGFNGIHHLEHLDRDLNCNEARRRALDAAKRGEGCCFWQGGWDYSANHCALFTFRFTSYDGPTFSGNSNDALAHCDCVGSG